MRSLRIKNGLVITTAAAAVALLLTACGPSQPQTQGSAGAGSTSASPSSSPAAPATSQPPSSSASSAAPSTSSAPAGTGPCKAATLTATTDATGGGAAGSVYMKLILTNSGTAPCVLKGFPGVSLTASATGAPIGAPAQRDASAPAVELILAPGQAGTAVLRYTQAANYTYCAKTPAAGYRIYPPGDTASLFFAERRDACSNADIKLLTIGAFQTK